MLFFILLSCQDKIKKEAFNSVKAWMGKEILFPKNSVFTIRGKDTINFTFAQSDYKLITYVDTAGCATCELKLAEWQRFMNEIDSTSSTYIPFLFYLYPKDTKDLLIEFKREAFDYPVCLDMTDEFNRLNKLAVNKPLRTFLLNKENKIIAIGNPIDNPNVKKLYIKILTGKENEVSDIQTTIECSTQDLNFGIFSKKEKRTGEILLRNTGNKPFIIYDVITSCGCTQVNYPKEPTLSGKTTKVTVTYEADKVGSFNKTCKIYGNMEGSPIRISVKGETY